MCSPAIKQSLKFRDFAGMYLRTGLRRITLKLGKFTNTKALFLVVSTDFPNWMSKVEKSVKVDLATCELYNWMKTIPLLVCAAEARRPRSLNFVQ